MDEYVLAILAGDKAKTFCVVLSADLTSKTGSHEELHIYDEPMTKATSRAHKVLSHGTDVACSLI